MSITGTPSEEPIPILLLKTKSTPEDGYEVHFSATENGLSFAPSFVPVLEHQLREDGLQTIRELLRNKQISSESGKKYGGMIFTSQRAVEAFAKLVEEGKGWSENKPSSSLGRMTTDHNQWPHLQSVPIYTVGPATSRALRAIPQDPPLNIFGAECGNGEALAHYMLDHYAEWYKDMAVIPPLLFSVGEQRRDIIPKTLMDSKLAGHKQIPVDELEVYGTGVMESFEQDFSRLLQKTTGGSTRWVVVFSPTGCEAMLRVLGLLDTQTGKVKESELTKRNSTYVATIGPTTRDFLKNTFGFEPDVCAGKPSPEGVREGILQFLQNS